ncbi:MAG: hypothetical protein RMI01_08605 [Thermodesulfovibrio sp.]|nr:hypothetical protein [Thermodesulfovibrio sp.]
MNYEGDEIKADKLLDFVRQAVTEYVVKQILSEQFAGILSNLSRFYVLYRWAYGESKEGKEIKILGPTERKIEDLEKIVEEKNELIDVLHYVLLLTEKDEREKIKEILISTGYVAQAISETLPDDSKEKKLIHVFLYSKERLKDEISSEKQGKLFWKRSR